MSQKLNGSELIALASATLGYKFECWEWIEVLYDACLETDTAFLFDALASNAKSFQKLTRLLAAGISDDKARKKVASELQDTFGRFSGLLERVLENCHENDGENFRKEFLIPSAESFEKMKTLLNDFARLKDFYLARRDKDDKA